MEWYLLNLAVLTVTYCYSAYNFEEQKQRIIVCLVGTFNWIMLSGLRHITIGPDTEVYKIYRFDKTLITSWDLLISDIINKYLYGYTIKDVGYPIVEKIFQIFSSDYQVYLLFIACVFFIQMGLFLYKYSANPYISFVLFSTLFYSFFAITGHRQTIATAIVVFSGIDLILNGSKWKFFLMLILASTIHNSVWVFLPFYYLSKININRLTILLYAVTIGFSFLFSNEILSVMQLLIGYEDYQQYDGAGLGTFAASLYLTGILVALNYKTIMQYGISTIGKDLTRATINALFIAIGLSSLLKIHPAFMRVVQYYSLFLLCLLPLIPSVISEIRMRFLFRICMVSTLVLSLIIRSPIYKFFWE